MLRGKCPREWDGSFLNECCSSSDDDDKMKKKCHPQWFGGTKTFHGEVWRPESRACLSSTAMQAWCKEEVGIGNPRLLYNKKCDRWSDFAKIDKGKVRDQAITEYCTDVVNTKHENEWDVLPDARMGQSEGTLLVIAGTPKASQKTRKSPLINECTATGRSTRA